MFINTYILLSHVRQHLVTLLRQEEGQDLIEYALLVALISIFAVGAVSAAGESVEALFQAVADELAGLQ